MKIVLSLCLVIFASSHSVALAVDKSIDRKAVDLLKRMVRAYRDIRSLDQNCEIADGEGAVPRNTKSRLLVQKPNLLLFETDEAIGGTDKSLKTIVQCDGKHLYSYNPRSGNYFSVANAPRSLDGFRSSASTLELAAITGMDIIEPFLKQATEIKMGPDEIVETVPCKSVLLIIWEGARKGEMNLQLGTKDNLIRRFVYTLTLVPSKLPPLPVPKPTEIPLAPTKTTIRPLCSVDDSPEAPKILARTSYTNTVMVNPPLPKGTFTWIAPSGAMEYQGSAGIQPLNQLKRNNHSANASAKAKPQKILTWEEFQKQAKRADQPPKPYDKPPRP